MWNPLSLFRRPTTATTALGEARAHRQLLEERLRIKAIKAQTKQLAIYRAADINRRDRDFRGSNASADLAIIPDSLTLIARARSLERDSWIGKSMIRSFRRNVVGRRIAVTPHAKDKNGKPLTALNREAHRQFEWWSRTKTACDVEHRKTFPQFQGMAASEKFTAGDHMWMWSYSPRFKQPDGRGRIAVDKSRPVYMQLQGLEPEQFNLSILSYEGREVRGGVEIDQNGAPVAYHIYTRSPWDLLYRYNYFSQRVTADRILHYMSQRRVLQTRGVTEMAPVMPSIRRMDNYEEASGWRAYMESCIGLIVTQDAAAGGGSGPSPLLGPLNPAAPTTGRTGSDEFVPGMTPRLIKGETVTPFVPTTAGNQYAPFTERQVRNIGAGVGQSFGQIARQNDANYSAARQDMLEDRKEIEPEQDLMVDDLIRPTYELWFHFAAMEGRFDGVEGFVLSEYLADRPRYVEAEFIPPPQVWINPKDEADAFKTLLSERLITREEIIAMRGQRYYSTFLRLADEQADADELGLSLPENSEDRKELRLIIQAYAQNRLGTLDNVGANSTDIQKMFKQAGVPANTSYKQPVLPIVDQTKPPPNAGPTGEPAAHGPSLDQPATNGNPVNGHANGNGHGRLAGLLGDNVSLPIVGVPARSFGNTSDGIPKDVPDYSAAADTIVCCPSCSYAVGQSCAKYNFIFVDENVCDSWTANTLTENIPVPSTGKTFPPGHLPGQPPLEDRFYPAADRTPRPTADS